MNLKILTLLGATALASAGAAQADTIVHHGNVHHNRVIVHHKPVPVRHWHPAPHHKVVHRAVVHHDMHH